MLSNLFANTIYVQIHKNLFRVRHIERRKEREVSALKPFTTNRLLVGEFREAEALLSKTLKDLGCGGLFKASPVIIMHPMEMVEGGLSEVEERACRELAMSVGARYVYMHIGDELSDKEVINFHKN